MHRGPRGTKPLRKRVGRPARPVAVEQVWKVGRLGGWQARSALKRIDVAPRIRTPAWHVAGRAFRQGSRPTEWVKIGVVRRARIETVGRAIVVVSPSDIDHQVTGDAVAATCMGV